MGPISKQNHGTRVIIVLNIYDMKANHFIIIIILVFLKFSVRINYSIKSVVLAIDEGCFNRDRFPFKDGICEVVFGHLFLLLIHLGYW